MKYVYLAVSACAAAMCAATALDLAGIISIQGTFEEAKISILLLTFAASCLCLDIFMRESK